MRSETVTTVLAAPRDAVFDYMSDIECLPEWATEFARELKRDGEDYKVVNGLGEFYFEIRADRHTGVIDIFAGPTKDEMAVFPTRAMGLPDGRTAYTFHNVPGARHARRAVRGTARVAAARVRQHRASAEPLTSGPREWISGRRVGLPVCGRRATRGSRR